MHATKQNTDRALPHFSIGILKCLMPFSFFLYFTKLSAQKKRCLPVFFFTSSLLFKTHRCIYCVYSISSELLNSQVGWQKKYICEGGGLACLVEAFYMQYVCTQPEGASLEIAELRCQKKLLALQVIVIDQCKILQKCENKHFKQQQRLPMWF